MVGPIDYRMNVLDPIQGYLQGLKFAEDRETVRLGREATRQGMDIQAAQEARAAEAFQMQRAEAARAVAEAQRGQEVLSQLFSNPNPTSEDFTQAFVANPAIREEIKFLMDRQTAEQTRGQLVAAQNIYAAAAQQNPDVLRRILTEQRDAMAASGNEPMVKLLDEGLRLLEADPETAMQQLRASTGLTILGLGGDVQKINETLGLPEAPKPTEAFRTLDAQLRAGGIVPQSEGGDGRYEAAMASAGGIAGGPTFRQATPDEAAQFGATAGQIDTATGRFYPIEPPAGMTLETTPEGTVRLVQGPGVGAAAGGRTRDYEYTTDARGQPVARPIAGTPAAAEVQAQRGRLEAAVGAGENMLQTIESVVGRPAGDGRTGLPPAEALEGILGLIDGRLPPRTQAQADLLARVEQISGRAFLEAFETLKGGGQITEIEGQKATQAIARLQRTQSLEAFQDALFEFADIVRRGIERSRNELRILPEVAPAPRSQDGGAQPAPSGRIRYDAEGNRIE